MKEWATTYFLTQQQDAVDQADSVYQGWVARREYGAFKAGGRCGHRRAGDAVSHRADKAAGGRGRAACAGPPIGPNKDAPGTVVSSSWSNEAQFKACVSRFSMSKATMRGQQATAQVTLKGKQFSRKLRITLRRENGGWKIDDGKGSEWKSVGSAYCWCGLDAGCCYNWPNGRCPRVGVFSDS
jgi:hypothetical protein